MSLKRLFDFSPQARFWCQIALFMFLFGLLAALGNGFGMGKMVEGFLFALGFFVLPFIALLLGVAALSEPYHLPRATLWAGATGVLAGGSLVVSVLLALGSNAGKVNAAAFWFGCCLPVLVPVLGVGLYFIVPALKEAQQELAKTHEAQALALIQKQGMVTLDDLAAELHLPADETEALVLSLVETKTLFGGLFDAPRSRVYSPEMLQAKKEQLADLAKGQPISLADLAARVQAPLELVHDWLQQLAQDHKVAGYLPGDTGVFHRLVREEWAGASTCPNCGAAWAGPALGEAGVSQCLQCKAEMFI
jgi:hypothetical protein